MLLQWVRADFYNPGLPVPGEGHQPGSCPPQRVIPSIKRLDTASVVLMLVLEFISVWIASRIGSSPLALEQIVIFSIMKLAATLLMTYFFLIIASVIISWIGARMRHPVVPLVYQLTRAGSEAFQKNHPADSRYRSVGIICADRDTIFASSDRMVSPDSPEIRIQIQ